MRLLLAEQKKAEQQMNEQTRLVAGSIFLKFGQTVFYSFTGCAPRDLCLHPHDLIQIEAIRDACKGGFRWYDFGEVSEDNESLAQFKSKWGTEPRPLFRYYYPARADRLQEDHAHNGGVFTNSTRKLWSALPERATAVLGDMIYRYM
jgi:lipid II:glycine glycyltransferase (peptidoglycan interpeptide bridge formation enzyme)